MSEAERFRREPMQESAAVAGSRWRAEVARDERQECVFRDCEFGREAGAVTSVDLESTFAGGGNNPWLDCTCLTQRSITAAVMLVINVAAGMLKSRALSEVDLAMSEHMAWNGRGN